MGLVALSYCTLVADTAHAEERSTIAESPSGIRPLLIGDTIPDVTLVTPRREAVRLADVLVEAPTILIYYRGGW